MSNPKRSVNSAVESTSKKIKLSPELQYEKRKLLQSILRREIESEINLRVTDLETIEERIIEARRCLEKVRQGVAAEYYSQNIKFQGNLQPAPHPAVKDTFQGKRPIKSEPASEEDSTQDGYQSGSKSDVYNQIQTRLDQSVSNSTNDLRQVKQEPNDEPVQQKLPRYIPPKYEEKDIVQIFEPRGNERKEKFRLIIGNVSKWIVQQDESHATHKWTVFIKCKKENFNLGSIISHVVFFLHPSYKPHDVVKVEYPPFKLTRRGWGEFPLRVKLHFVNPLDNPVDVIHNLKLDRTHSGLETFGAETIVDVWCHTKEEASKEFQLNENKENENKQIVNKLTLKDISFTNEISKDILSDLFDEPESLSKDSFDGNINIKTESEEVAIDDIDIKPLTDIPETQILNANCNVDTVVNPTGNGVEGETKTPDANQNSMFTVANNLLNDKTNHVNSAIETSSNASDKTKDPESPVTHISKKIKYEIVEDFNDVVLEEIIINEEDVSYSDCEAPSVPSSNVDSKENRHDDLFDYNNVEIKEEIIYDTDVSDEIQVVEAKEPSQIIENETRTTPDNEGDKLKLIKLEEIVQSPTEIKVSKPLTDQKPVFIPIKIVTSMSSDDKTKFSNQPKQFFIHDKLLLSSNTKIIQSNLKTQNAIKPLKFTQINQNNLTTTPTISTQSLLANKVNQNTETASVAKNTQTGNHQRVIFFDSVSKTKNQSPLFKIVAETPIKNGVLKNNSLKPTPPAPTTLKITNLKPNVPKKLICNLPNGKQNTEKQINSINNTTQCVTTQLNKPIIVTTNASGEKMVILQRKILPGMSLLKKAENPAPPSKIENKPAAVEPPNMIKQYESEILQRCPTGKIEFAVSWLVKKFPLVDEKVKKDNFKYKNLHPYCAPDRETFLKWPLAKQRAAEWMRAKIISRLLPKLFPNLTTHWSVVQIYDWARLMGFSPRESLSVSVPSSQEPLMFNFTPPPDLKIMPLSGKKYQEDDEIIDVVTVEPSTLGSSPNKTANAVHIPLEENVKGLGDFFVESCTHLVSRGFAKEEIAANTTYPAAVAVLISAFNSVAEDLIRRSFAASTIRHNNEHPNVIEENDVKNAILSRDEFDIFTNEGLGTETSEL